MAEEKNRAPAAAAAVKAVEAMAAAQAPMSLAELSVATGLNKNILSRSLSALIEAGWVVCRAETGKYALTLQLFRLGSSVLHRENLTRCAEPYMKRLNDLTGECIQLAVLHNSKAVYVAQLESKQVAGVRGRIGASYSLDTTAPGKTLKAFVLKDPGMEAERRQGYATDCEEFSRGIICIAAPVYDYSGEAIAALGISSLVFNHTMEELVERYADALLEQAGKLSCELGYSGTQAE